MSHDKKLFQEKSPNRDRTFIPKVLSLSFNHCTTKLIVSLGAMVNFNTFPFTYIYKYIYTQNFKRNVGTPSNLHRSGPGYSICAIH